MTRQELAEQVNLAYDDYFNAIQELGTANDIVPPSPRLVQDDPRTADQRQGTLGRISRRSRRRLNQGILGRHRGEAREGQARMTRGVTIVNTSNWEHEDVSVMVRNRAPVRLKPGECMTVGPYVIGTEGDVELHMVAIEEMEPKPFMDADGKQDLPGLTIHKPRPSEDA